MPTLVCPISQSLQDALEKLSRETRDPISHLVSSALSRFVGVPLHTLFQVSTSGALERGVYEKAVSSTAGDDDDDRIHRSEMSPAKRSGYYGGPSGADVLSDTA